MKIKTAIHRYTKPRFDPATGVDTSGDERLLVDKNGKVLPRRGGPGVLAGGIQGYLMDGVSGAAGGVVGAYAGKTLANKFGRVVPETDNQAAHIKPNMLAGAVAGTATGALTSTALSVGIAAVTSGVFNPQAVMLSAVSGGLAGLSGTLATAGGGNGVMAGGIQGFVGNRMSGLAAGSVGGYLGLQVGEATGSTTAAMVAGTGSGALIGVGTTAGLLKMVGSEIPGKFLVTSAVLGGLAGAVGTISASKRSAPRDGSYGGTLAGRAAGAMVGNGHLGLSTAAAAAFAARAKTDTGKVILGVAGGAATGALVGSLQGPGAILSGALAGAIAAPVGAVVGTTTRQVMRNVNIDAINGINKKFVDPYLEKHTLTKTQKLAVGAAAGGLMLGTTGMVAGMKGVAVMGTVGAVLGAVQTDKWIDAAKLGRESAANSQEYSKPHLYGEAMKAQLKISSGE